MKRSNEPSDDEDLATKKAKSSQILGITRSISACQRCRVKKIKCDQNFPKCSKCDKAKVDCIGMDPATGREVPRSYVIHLEDRIAALELRLKLHGIAEDEGDEIPSGATNTPEGVKNDDIDEQQQQHVLLNEVRFNSINPNTQLVSKTRSISSNQSISFAKLMATAVKFRSRRTPALLRYRSNTANTNTTNSTTTPDVEDPSTTVSKEEIQLSLLPPKRTAQEFLKIFFAQSNSQLPILHREEFLRCWFVPIYGKLDDDDISLASDNSNINKLFVYGELQSVKEEPGLSELDLEQYQNPYLKDETLTWFYQYKQIFNQKLNQCRANHEKFDPIKVSSNIKPPAKFHKCLYFLNIVFGIASSVHLLQYPKTISDSFKLTALKYIDQVYSSTDQLESLQGILLLALYSIMRPAVPGCWYVVGSALRLCIDLGLHNDAINQQLKIDAFTLDKRRRLFWCTYSLDRQICFYLTRPVGFPDECITTPFPTELDDALIIPHDPRTSDYLKLQLLQPPESSYKFVSVSMFEIRKIQCEVQKILFENCELPRKFNTLVEWKQHIFNRLKTWKDSFPKTKHKLNCGFILDFFYLNYNHTVLILFGLSPKNFKLSNKDFAKVNESSKGLISIYSNLLASKSINYTWAAILNLFTAGTSYLYSIYNSELIRSRNSLAEVKKYTQDCITVLNSLVDRCDAALTCKNTYEVLTAAVVKLKYNETVYGHIKLKFPDNMGFLKPFSNNNLNNLVHNLKSEQEQQEKKEKELQERQKHEDMARKQKEQYQFQSQSFDQSLAQPLEEFIPGENIRTTEYENFSVKLESELNPFLPNEFTLMEPTPQPMPQVTPGPYQGQAQAPDQLNKPIIQKFLDNQPTGEIMGYQSPSTFEWSNSNDPYENELDNFFNELENSPNSTNSRRDSFSENELIASNLLGLSNNPQVHTVQPQTPPQKSQQPQQPQQPQQSGQLAPVQPAGQPRYIQLKPSYNSTPFSNESTDSSSSSPLLLNHNGHLARDLELGSAIDPGSEPVSHDPVPPDTMPSKDGRRVFEMIHQVPIDSIWDQFFTNNSSVYSGFSLDPSQQ